MIMKRIALQNRKSLSIFFMFFSLLFILVLASCQKTPTSRVDEDMVTVILKDSEQFVTLSNDSDYFNKEQKEPNIARIHRGEDVSFLLSTKDNYYPDTCSFARHQFVETGDNLYTIKLFKIMYSLRFEVTFKYVEPAGPDNPDGPDGPDDPVGPVTPTYDTITITYDANGGSLNDPNNGVYTFTNEHHPRPNTSSGVDIVKRDGYNLIGWNTKNDGTGEHIGLGSRYLDPHNLSFTLYAEWVKYSNKQYFQYTVDTNNEITITSYLNNEQVISIPEYIDNKAVCYIAKNAFTNCNVETLVLPKTIKEIAKEAFVNCDIKEIYLYDNIVSVYDDCFINCPNFSTVHINAIEGARFVTADRHATYADKVDRLILNKDKKKVVIFGGSGAYYNVDACLLHELYPHYEVFNLAVNGWFNGPVQMEIIMPFIGQNDYLLHCVEMCGRRQFMTDIVMCEEDDMTGYDYRFFCCLELNFDLISLADIRHVTHFFDSFTAFNNGRDRLTPQPYTDYTEFADERGDYTSDRKKTIPADGGRIITHEGEIDPDSISLEGATRLTNYYEELISKGTKIFFSYCPVNKDSLSNEDLDYVNMMEYGSRVTNYFGSYCTILNSLESVLLDFECFADSDWHLDYEHALTFTQELASYMGRLV